MYIEVCKLGLYFNYLQKFNVVKLDFQEMRNAVHWKSRSRRITCMYGMATDHNSEKRSSGKITIDINNIHDRSVILMQAVDICDICTIKSPAFETTRLLSPQLILPPCRNYCCRSIKKLYKTCSCCGRDTWHIESKHILQPPKYF